MKKVLTIFLLLVAMVIGGCSGTQTTDCQSRIDAIMIVPIAEAVPVTTIRIKEAVMFDWDKYVIRDDQMPIINKVVDLMNEYPDTILVIDGFASSEGPEDYNQYLSEDRADAVEAILVEKGIDPDRIESVVGHGATGKFGELLKSFNSFSRIEGKGKEIPSLFSLK